MTSRYVFLPGLGADERLFRPQVKALQGSVCPPWISPENNETLGSYAERFAESIDLQPGALLIGFSFGGMVALEIASRCDARKPRGVVLISGIRSKKAVTTAFRLQQAIGSIAPHGLAKAIISGPLAGAFGKLDGLDSEHIALLRAMASDIDIPFLFWAAKACARWGFDGSCPVPVSHVHGRRDRIIPYRAHPDLPGGEATMLDAGHLITWSRAAEVTSFIRGADPADNTNDAATMAPNE